MISKPIAAVIALLIFLQHCTADTTQVFVAADLVRCGLPIVSLSNFVIKFNCPGT